MEHVTALILAGGRVEELGVLTQRRAKAAVPFAGTYRIIDFPLSNLARSGILRVGVLSQYNPASLMDHVGVGEAWGLHGKGRELAILPPYQADNSFGWYAGNADAVNQNRDFLEDSHTVMVLSGDHVYEMDYRPLLNDHIKSGAALTMVVKQFPKERLKGRFGVAKVSADNRITSYEEKPENPQGDYGSLTIYVFRRAKLEQYLDAAPGPGQLFHFGTDIIPRMVEKELVRAHVFDGTWMWARTLDEYYHDSMNMLRIWQALDECRVWTNVEESGTGGAGPCFFSATSQVYNSRISAGCTIHGRVLNSVLSPGVVVEEGAEVRDSILMQNVKVGAGTVLQKIMADKYVEFGPSCKVGSASECPPNRVMTESHRCGVTVIGKDTFIPGGSVIGGNCQIEPRSVFKKRIFPEHGSYLKGGEE
jgi:glucose-1-phosphate adenylyltransferase